MSALTEIMISCPHCRRQYQMKIDPERLQRLKTRATCGRCGKTFDAASRIVAAQEAGQAEPKPPRTDVKPPPVAQLHSTLVAPRDPPSSELRDEMEELAREFAEAAARFTPVGVKRATLGLGTDAPAPTPPLPTEEEPTKPGIKPASMAALNASFPSLAPDPSWSSAPPVPSPPEPPPSATAETLSPRSPEPFSLEAEPAGEDEFAAAMPTRSLATPRSWLELGDPGLASLQSPPSPGATALEALLSEAETILLPPPPTAS